MSRGAIDEVVTKEAPSKRLKRCVITSQDELGDHWENDLYYGVLRRFNSGFPIGDGPYAIISISAIDETARHDWRDFQQIKNSLVGDEWEAVELYPAESRLVDPSNRFYLWAVPKGVFQWGLSDRRNVVGSVKALAPQRPFPK